MTSRKSLISNSLPKCCLNRFRIALRCLSSISASIPSASSTKHANSSAPTWVVLDILSASLFGIQKPHSTQRSSKIHRSAPAMLFAFLMSIVMPHNAKRHRLPGVSPTPPNTTGKPERRMEPDQYHPKPIREGTGYRRLSAAMHKCCRCKSEAYRSRPQTHRW